MMYLLEVSACLIAFYTLYHFLLDQKSFHKWNRFYLLSTLILAFIIPAVHLPIYQVIIPAAPALSSSVSEINIVDQAISQSYVLTKTIEPLFALATLYFIVVIISLVKLSTELFKIYRIIHSSENCKKDNCTEVYVGNKLPLSSFFRYMLIPDIETLTPFEYKHELAHIAQHHSVDKVFASICSSFLWFNPIAHLYQKRIAEVHEYLADESAKVEFEDGSYLDFLCNLVSKESSYMSISPFYSLIKNRLLMLEHKSDTSSKRIILAIPLSLLLLATFSCEEYYTTAEVVKKQSVTDQIHSFTDILAMNSVSTSSNIKYGIEHCECESFNMMYVSPGKDIIKVFNQESDFNEQSLALLEKARPGDMYLIDKIKFDCEEGFPFDRKIILSISDELTIEDEMKNNPSNTYRKMKPLETVTIHTSFDDIIIDKEKYLYRTSWSSKKAEGLSTTTYNENNASGLISIYDKFGKQIISKQEYYGDVPSAFNGYIFDKGDYAYVITDFKNNIVERSTFRFEPSIEASDTKENDYNAIIFLNAASIQLITDLEDLNFFSERDIESFEFIVPNQDHINILNKGNRLNDEVLSFIKNNIKDTDSIRLKNIISKGKDGTPLPVHDFLIHKSK